MSKILITDKQTKTKTKKKQNKQTNKHSRPSPAQTAYPTDVALRQQGALRVLRGVTLKTFLPQNNRVGNIRRKPRPRPQSNHIYGRMASIKTLAALPRPNGSPHRCRSASARCITCVKRCYPENIFAPEQQGRKYSPKTSATPTKQPHV